MQVANNVPAAALRRLTLDLASPRLMTLQIIVILIVAAALRLYQITQPFTDAFSWRQASAAIVADNYYRRDWNMFYPEVSWNGPGPSFRARELPTVSYLAALLYVVFGQHDWVGRSIGVVFGLWGIFALYQLVRRVWDEAHAVAAAAVLALMPGAIFIDRSFLPDPALVALVTTSLWMLVIYFQTEQLRYLMLACLAGGAGLLTGLPGVLIAVPMAYAAFALLDREWLVDSRRPLLLTLAALGTLGVVFWYLDWTRRLATAYPPYEPIHYGTWVWLDGLAKWWDRGYFVSSTLATMHDWLWTGPVMGLAALGLLFSPRAAPTRRAAQQMQSPVDDARRAPWLFHWWLVGCAVYYIIGARELNDKPWSFHLFNPPLAALAGHGLVMIWSFGTQHRQGQHALVRVGVVLLVLLGIGQVALQAMYDPEHAAKSYQLGLGLREMTQPGDLVVTLASDPRDPTAIYYSQRRGWIFPPADVERGGNALPKDDRESIRLLDELRAQGARWLGITNDREDFWVEHDELVSYVKKTCEFVVKTDAYVIYRIRSPAEVAHRSEE
jgi:4-amino-4-deoxy-L-arabinose transferase-like glycosyltransferase